MKLEEDKLNTKDGVDNKVIRTSKKPSIASSCDLKIETPLSSTVRSIDLPPNEYET